MVTIESPRVARQTGGIGKQSPTAPRQGSEPVPDAELQ